MDDVPVKIVERYKPPPLVYQLPQTITNKLSQEPGYYEQPQFQYSFQLEQNVLTQVQCWRQVRQRDLEARQERLERRKQERQRAIEAQQKEMLGAVQYPSAADLSSSSDDEGNEGADEKQSDAEDSGANNSSCDGDESRGPASQPNETVATTIADNSEKKSINSTQSSNFHNILQPTVISQFKAEHTKLIGVGVIGETKESFKKHTRVPSLNYSDFEYDNSSPFDNIELKTINDLDILAQVLHNTQINNAKVQERLEDTVQQQDKEQTPTINLAVLSESKAAIEKIDFNSINQCDAENIPNQNDTNHLATVNSDEVVMQQSQVLGNNYNIYHHSYSPTTTATTPSNHTTPQHYIQHHQVYQMQNNSQLPTSVAYNQYYQPQMDYSNSSSLSNHNYLMATYCNGQHQQQPQQLQKLPFYAATESAEENSLKSKSVPDILRELKTEINNSELRRARNLSHNLDNEASQLQIKMAPIIPNPTFNELAAPARKLAQRISSMGFPLERVAKVVNICGADDKKIIEHLIPLSELVDLGFDETKISAALLKFDNNKDKALDYLIS